VLQKYCQTRKNKLADFFGFEQKNHYSLGCIQSHSTLQTEPLETTEPDTTWAYATRKLSGNGARLSKNDTLEADQALGPILVPDSYRDFDPQPRFILVRVLGPAGYLVSISFA
jgi:hypothetical protein